jgi:hypothetical protein
MRLHRKLWWAAVSDGRGADEDGTETENGKLVTRHYERDGARGEPVDGLNAAGFAAGEESVHAHCAAGRVRAGGGARRPVWRPGYVAVRMVL